MRILAIHAFACRKRTSCGVRFFCRRVGGAEISPECGNSRGQSPQGGNFRVPDKPMRVGDGILPQPAPCASFKPLRIFQWRCPAAESSRVLRQAFSGRFIFCWIAKGGKYRQSQYILNGRPPLAGAFCAGKGVGFSTEAAVPALSRPVRSAPASRRRKIPAP